jgi:hypothetical protein
MEIEQMFGWIAFLLIAGGITTIGHKHRSGFVAIALGGVITGILVYQAELYGLVAQNVTAVALNVYSFCVWGKKRGKKQ